MSSDNSAPTAPGEGISAASVAAASFSSDSSSQSLNSQENALQCSESLVSSGPSDDSQTDSQAISLGGSVFTAIQLPARAGNEVGSDVSTSDSGLGKDACDSEARVSAPTLPFVPQSHLIDKLPVPASNGLHYSPGLLAASNLSQLAELAANKSAIHQTPPNTTQLSAQPMQPHLIGNQTRFVLPGQGIPTPIIGTYPSGTLMQVPGQYQGFPPVPHQVPPPFIKGSNIQLTTGDVKRVEDLSTEDFIHSIRQSPELKLETSTVVKIEDGTEPGNTHITFTINSSKIQVILNCPVEHPFFVYGQGWTSSSPEQSSTKYNLNCQQLKVGDVCIFLSASSAPSIPGGLGFSSSPAIQVSGAGSTPTQSASVVLSSALKSPSVSSSTGQTVTSVSVSYAQTLPGIVTLPGNIPGVVVTSSMPPGIPAVYPGSFPSAQNIGQGKVAGQSGTDRSSVPQPVQGFTPDGKPSESPHSTAAVPGGFPLSGAPFYQPLTGTFMTAMPPGQTFVQGTVMPQGSVGNGLLVAAVGFVPGRPPAPFVQPGMLYGSTPMEMLQKGGDSKPEEYSQKERTDSQTELSQPDAKRARGETEVK